MESVLHHAEQEVREHLTEDQLKIIGASFKAHIPLADTRPHPGAPQQVYPAAVANVVLKPSDMVRDFLGC
jgi:hypothetical protein